jgi:hypothetical protein
VPALFDFTQDAVALHGLTEPRDQMLGGLAFAKVY